jgi:hypothetical protein
MDYKNFILAPGFCSSCYFIRADCILVASPGEKYSAFAIVLAGIGLVTGIITAEYIRRKIGLETFFARIYGPNEMDEKKK